VSDETATIAAEPWGVEPPVPAEDRQWYPAIEVLRGIAAVAVVIDHTWALAGGSPGFGFGLVAGLGSWGVDIFFLLSGYLLVDFFWVNRRGKSTLEFYVRRFFRIAPAYYVCIGILYLFFAQHDQVFSVQGMKQILANVTFTQHFFPATASNLNVDGSLWTLSIEMVLYLVMPLFAYVISKRPVIACSVLVAIGVGWDILVFYHGGALRSFYFGASNPSSFENQYIWISRQFIGLIPIFTIGMGLRWAVLHGYFDFWVKRPTRHPSLLVVFALLVPSLLVLRYTGVTSLWSMNVHLVTYDYLIALLAVPALLYASRPSPVRLNAAMRGGVWMGERSYGLYLWHFPVILSVLGIGSAMLAPNTHHMAIKVVLIFVISIALGWGSFSLVERPGRLYGRDLGRKLTKKEHHAKSAGG
jgi:peptidoglycan/LPS O-acetylase OafA/YrhL